VQDYSEETVMALAELIKPCMPSSSDTADEMMTAEEEILKLEHSTNQIRQGFKLLLSPHFFEIISSMQLNSSKSFDRKKISHPQI
jgi:methionyl-tRNA synthetase